jgi:hypothetical protein
MTITYETEISELMDVGQVQEKTDEIKKIVDEYKDDTGESLKTELTSNLSPTTFYIDNNPLLHDKTEEVYNSLNSNNYIDLSVLSTIISKSKEKREEELNTLKKAVINHINELNASIVNYSLKLIAMFPGSANYNERYSILSNLSKLKTEQKLYEDKLRSIEKEIGAI